MSEPMTAPDTDNATNTKDDAASKPWRVGTHYNIHVYAGDRPVATFHRAEWAAQAVADHNAALDGERARAGEGERGEGGDLVEWVYRHVSPYLSPIISISGVRASIAAALASAPQAVTGGEGWKVIDDATPHDEQVIVSDGNDVWADMLTRKTFYDDIGWQVACEYDLPRPTHWRPLPPSPFPSPPDTPPPPHGDAPCFLCGGVGLMPAMDETGREFEVPCPNCPPVSPPPAGQRSARSPTMDADTVIEEMAADLRVALHIPFPGATSRAWSELEEQEREFYRRGARAALPFALEAAAQVADEQECPHIARLIRALAGTGDAEEPNAHSRGEP